MLSFQTFLIALGLSADAFAVSVASGISEKHIRFSQALKMSFAFWFFQGFMPVIGYWLAFLLKDFMSAFDHWIAFGVLLVIGGKMVYEGMDHPETTGEKKQKNSFSLKNILLLAIATSIDALAVGFSYAALNESIVVPALVIAGVTFFLSFLGIEFGRRFGSHFGSRAEIAGGLILVGIGAKILFNHTIGIL